MDRMLACGACDPSSILGESTFGRDFLSQSAYTIVICVKRHKTFMAYENSSKEEDPQELFRLAKSGDKEAFGRLYTLYFTPVYRYIYLRLKNKQDAEDVTQVVFLKLFTTNANFEDRKISPLAYFFTVARNALIDHVRKSSHDPIFDDEELAEKSDKIEKKENPFSVHENKDLIKRALEELDGEQHDVVIYRFMEGFSYEEIGEMLGKSDDAVRQICSRAVKKIRVIMKKEI